jgi:hypothetical protein
MEVKDVNDIQGLNDDINSLSTLVNNVSDHRQNFISTASIRGNQYIIPFKGSTMEQREKRYVAKALAGVPRGTFVLNWPCGCSRLLPLLKRFGYNVTSVDSSSYAINRIRLHGGLFGEDCVGDKDNFQVVDIFQTSFDDDCFGAVVVNQLFRCLPVPQIRQLILKELRRICTGPIIVSFFCNTMIYENACCERGKFHKDEIKYYFRLNRKAFVEEVRKCGLTVEKWVPKYSLLSKLACAVLVRDKGCKKPFASVPKL